MLGPLRLELGGCEPTMWVLQTELGPSGRAASAFTHPCLPSAGFLCCTRLAEQLVRSPTPAFHGWVSLLHKASVVVAVLTMLLKHHPAACGYGELFSKHKFGANVVWLVVDLSSGPIVCTPGPHQHSLPCARPGSLTFWHSQYSLSFTKTLSGG